MTSPTDANTRWDARLWGLLIVLCSVLFLDGLDVSMVGVALPSIRESLDLSASSLQWVVSGYVLGYGGLLLLGGRAADLLGRRAVFLIALGVFAAASLLGGLVSDPGLLIGARFIKGASAAFTAPAGLSIITTTFAEGPVRNRALAFYTACGASGFSMGLVLSGLLTEVGWRWTFLLPAPIAIAALFAAIRYVPRAARPDRAGQRYDVTGAVTATASMLLFVYAVVEAPQAGWGSAQTLLSFLVAAALLATFVVVESRVEQPLVRLGIFRSPALIRANLGAVILIGSYFGFQFLVTQYLQTLLGWSALETGLGFLPAGVMVALGATRLGPIVDRYGTAAGDRIRFVDAGVRPVPTCGRELAVRGRRLPDDHADRRRIRAVLPVAQHPGHRRGRRSRAGAGVRADQHVLPGRRGAHPGGGHRADDVARRQHRAHRARPARQLPSGTHRVDRCGGSGLRHRALRTGQPPARTRR
jgi:MFS family permease